MTFPAERPRRLRASERLRTLVRETRLSPGRLIYPMFVTSGEGVRREIASLPGCFHLSADEAAREISGLLTELHSALLRGSVRGVLGGR